MGSVVFVGSRGNLKLFVYNAVIYKAATIIVFLIKIMQNNNTDWN